MKLSPLIAGSLAAAVLAAVTVWVFAHLPGLWVWAAFIGWASYDHSGANRKALLTSSVCMVFGVVMAWLVALVVAGDVLPLPSTVASALAAGLASFIIVYLSRFMPFSNVPATFYGFASSFAFLLMHQGSFSMSALSTPDRSNVLLCVSVSLLVGSVLGVVQQRLSYLLTDAPRRPVEPEATRLTPLTSGPRNRGTTPGASTLPRSELQ
jgi:Protein of unknown function (DUF1097)